MERYYDLIIIGAGPGGMTAAIYGSRAGLSTLILEMGAPGGKLIKTNDTMKHIPVVIFSSLVNDEMKRKGEQLGADAQLSKPEIGQLVEAIDGLLGAKA